MKGKFPWSPLLLALAVTLWLWFAEGMVLQKYTSRPSEVVNFLRPVSRRETSEKEVEISQGGPWLILLGGILAYYLHLTFEKPSGK